MKVSLYTLPKANTVLFMVANAKNCLGVGRDATYFHSESTYISVEESSPPRNPPVTSNIYSK